MANTKPYNQFIPFFGLGSPRNKGKLPIGQINLVSHLHVHTEYSMLDGLARLDPLINRASELGMKSLAITDHGGLYGAIDFYRSAKGSGVKPIIGCEMYVTTKSRHDKDPSD